MQDWVKIAEDETAAMWFSGIYKIRTYDGKAFHAYFIRDGYRNWGDYVCPPPERDASGYRCWTSLESAQEACEEHAKTHNPSRNTVKRAAEILTQFQAEGR